MSYPFDDTNFTIWHGDLDTQLKRFHNVTLKELGIDRRSLQSRFYGGESLFAALDAIIRQHLPQSA